MKTIALLSLLAMTVLQSAFAIDQESLNTLKRSGYIVTMGEFTGAGSKMSLRNVAGFIHPQGIILKGECKNILVKKEGHQGEPTVADITKIVVDQTVINASEFEGFFSK